MTDPTPEPESPRTKKSDAVPPAEEPATVSPAAEPEAAPTASATPTAETESPESGPAVVERPDQQVVYVTAPQPPRDRGNRGIGSLIALVSAVVYAALLAVVAAFIGVAAGRPLSFGFVGQGQFYIPVLLFAIGFVLLVLVLNRASWWAYILGSLVLAVFVYFATIAVGLLSTGVILDTPSEAAARYAAALRNPFIIASALLAREVSIWVGAAISSRGRRVKARNVETREAFELEQAETRAAHERGNVTTPTAV